MKFYHLIPMFLFCTVTGVSAKFILPDGTSNNASSANINNSVSGISSNGQNVPALDEVIAKTSQSASLYKSQSALDLVQISELLKSSETVGNSEVNIGLLKKALRKAFQTNPTTEVRYLYAKVLQKEHAFDGALAVLEPAQKSEQIHVNSQLLAANLYMTKGEFAEAKRLCLMFLGVASLETAATCAIDAESHTGNAQKSFDGLKGVTANKPLSFNSRHVLAELAFRTNQPEQTLNYLRDIDLASAPISLVVLWSDAQLAVENFDEVLTTVPQLVKEHSDLEDALLLRLAMAEAKVGQSQTWQSRMQARVQLREQRQDSFHASDLALYYLELTDNKEKARYWAEINWQQAKLDQDRLLLQRVNAAYPEYSTKYEYNADLNIASSNSINKESGQ